MPRGCAATDALAVKSHLLNGQRVTMSDKIRKSDEEWRKELTPEQYRIARQKGTERAYRGVPRQQGAGHLHLRLLRYAALRFRRQV